EGPAVDGTVVVCEQLRSRGERLDWCIVGEPTSVRRVGDMIKNGRRGSLSGKLTVAGVQGHIAYPQLARNPIHQTLPALAELAALEWDRGNEFFPPTSFQISNMHGGTGAANIIPGSVIVDFNFRYCTESVPEQLQARTEAILQRHGLEYRLDWVLGGRPFLTRPGELVAAVQEAIRGETGIEAQLSTTGGTSDGRFISRICPQVIELGPVNASIHKIDEHVRVADIESLKNIYRRTIELLEAGL
ncbi:MAG TPA: succinyl-diaminopimelate desuccinylase, partial [Ramlibacter sp.]|nr:succinyl-diaminopimelate desuccinylase [Ramlibacter sp.]